MATDKIEVDLLLDDGDSVSNVEKKAVSLKQQLREMKALLASGTLDNDAFNRLAAEAGALQDRLDDVTQRVRNLASDSRALDGFIDLTQGIVGGFAAVQGITALVGDENEELQKTMVKLQAAMAALSGVQAVVNSLNKDSAALTALTTLRTSAATVAQNIYTFSVGASTGALKAFRIALLGTGIGIIIFALYKAAEAMGLFGDSVENTTEDIEKQAEALEKLSNKFKDADNAQLERLKQESEILKARAKLRNASEEELLKIDRDFLIKKRALYQLQVDDVKTNEALRIKAKQELQGVENELELNSIARQQAAKDALEKKAEKSGIETIAQRDARIKREKEEQAKLEERLRIEEFEEEQEFQKNRAEAIVKAAEERQKNINEQLQNTLALNRAIRERDKAEAEQERKDYEDIWNAKVSIASDGYSLLNNLGELALGAQFRQTAAGKVLALAQIATDTALAFVSGLRIAQQSAQGTGPAAALAFPAFYASQAAAILSVGAKARAMLSGGGSGGGFSTPSFGSFNSQPPPLTGFFPTSQREVDFGRVEVVVEERKITDAQGRNARIRANAEII